MPSRPSPSRTTPTTPPALSPDVIVRRALELLDEHGVEWLSMRKLAGELGVSAQALYWHFPSKDALCEAVVAAASEELRSVATGRGGIERRLARYCHGLREHWRRHPSVLALSRRYVPTAAGTVAEQGVGLLTEWGFAPAEAAEHHRALVWLVLGFVYVEQNLVSSAHHRPLDTTGRRYTVQITPAAGAPAAHELDADALFARMVATTLAGLRAQRPS